MLHTQWHTSTRPKSVTHRHSATKITPLHNYPRHTPRCTNQRMLLLRLQKRVCSPASCRQKTTFLCGSDSGIFELGGEPGSIVSVAESEVIAKEKVVWDVDLVRSRAATKRLIPSGSRIHLPGSDGLLSQNITRSRQILGR